MTDQTTPKQTKSEQIEAQRIAQQEEQRRIFGSSPFYSGRTGQAKPARPAEEIEGDGFISRMAEKFVDEIGGYVPETSSDCAGPNPHTNVPQWPIGTSPKEDALDGLKRANQLDMTFNRLTTVQINDGEYDLDLINRYTPEQLATIFREEDGFHTWKLLQEIMRLRAALQGYLK